MPSAVNIEIDKSSLRNFQNALQLYQKATRKDMAEVINRAAVNLGFRAAQFTRKADVKDLAVDMGDNPYAIVNWWHTKKGKKHPRRAQMDRAVHKFFKMRAATFGFIRRGWIQAAKKLKEQSGVRVFIRVEGGSRRPGKGSATAARDAIRTFAELVNYATTKSPTSGAALIRYGGDGLKQAIRFVTADIREYAEKKLAQRAGEFNRRS